MERIKGGRTGMAVSLGAVETVRTMRPNVGAKLPEEADGAWPRKA